MKMYYEQHLVQAVKIIEIQEERKGVEEDRCNDNIIVTIIIVFVVFFWYILLKPGVEIGQSLWASTK